MFRIPITEDTLDIRVAKPRVRTVLGTVRLRWLYRHEHIFTAWRVVVLLRTLYSTAVYRNTSCGLMPRMLKCARFCQSKCKLSGSKNKVVRRPAPAVAVMAIRQGCP
jgi:hypothetical protein